MAINHKRLEVANQVLQELGKYEFTVDRSRLYFSWVASSGKSFRRLWLTKADSDYPTWYRNVRGYLGCGGTVMTAIAHLALWVRELPCYPIETWEHWCGESVRMRGGDTIIPLLKENQYPTGFACVFCGNPKGRKDWYWFSKHPKHSGFGCCHPECQQIKDLRNKLAEKL